MDKEKVFWWSLLSFVFTVPLSPFINVRLLILTLLISLLMLTRKMNWVHLLLTSWDIVLYLAILIFGLAYSQDVTSGLKSLETNFSFLAMALIFFRVPKVTEKHLSQIFYAFALGLFVGCVLCLGNAIFRFIDSANTDVFFFYQLTHIINLQPTYFAYYLIFSITFGLYLLSYGKTEVDATWITITILFFFLVLLLTGGQTAYVSLLLVFSYFILKFFLGDRSGKYGLTIALVSVMTATMFLMSSVNVQNNLNDSWDRFDLWRAAIDANPNAVFGVGTGDSKSVLNEFFRQHNLNQYANESLNSHNQFIHTFFSNGFIGLVALLMMLARPLYLAFKNNHSFGILILFPFLIYGMTEVFLGRYQGVVFFALLHQVFVSYYTSSAPAFFLKEA